MVQSELLMVEDNRGDVVLVQEAMAKARIRHNITVVRDGVEAMAYLRRSGSYSGAVRPDLVILDLKLPRKSGCEVLAELAADAGLRDIPLVVLSSSSSELEIAKQGRSTHRHMVKPSTFAGYLELVTAIDAFVQETLSGRPV